MTKTSTFNQNAKVFLILIGLVLTLVFLLHSKVFLAHQSLLSSAITIDFIIIIPLVYFLLIRKRNISNFTVAPFLILCTVIASYTIPIAHQNLLSLAKTWLIPTVELSILTLVILNVRKAIKCYKNTSRHHTDFYSALVSTCKSMFPKTVAKLVANEIALIYYGFFNFKKRTLQPNEFSNYKGSGILSTLGAIIFVIAIEMVTIHVLIAQWSALLAWSLTGLSFYSALQLVGIIRSVPKRPIIINEQQLLLRFGILSETKVNIKNIDSIKLANTSDFENDKDTKSLSLLGELEHGNIVIYLKTPEQIHFLYGKPKPYTKLLLFVDNHQNFKSQVETYLSK